MSSGAFGARGGNLDCGAITKFATLYLQVSHEGAFLYYLIAFGQSKNLDQALKETTLNLMRWLQKDYGISLAESSQLIVLVVEYRIPKIASSVVEVIAVIRKRVLKTLRHPNLPTY